jgi:hypothetical protein
MLCSQENFRARGEGCRDQIRCGGAELVLVGVVHFLASRGETRAIISAFREFSMPCRQENFRAPDSRKGRYETSAAKPPPRTVGCPRARNRKVRPSARWSITRRRDCMREDSRSTTTRRVAGCEFRGASARRGGFGTHGHFGFLEQRGAMNNPSTNQDFQKENCTKF